MCMCVCVCVHLTPASLALVMRAGVRVCVCMWGWGGKRVGEYGLCVCIVAVLCCGVCVNVSVGVCGCVRVCYVLWGVA